MVGALAAHADLFRSFRAAAFQVCHAVIEAWRYRAAVPSVRKF
jgi:hypothetical protein